MTSPAGATGLILPHRDSKLFQHVSIFFVAQSHRTVTRTRHRPGTGEVTFKVRVTIAVIPLGEVMPLVTRCHGGASRTDLDGRRADRAPGQLLHCLAPIPPTWHQEPQETARGKQPQAVTCEIRSHRKKTSCHRENMLTLIGAAFLGSCKINISGRMLLQAPRLQRGKDGGMKLRPGIAKYEELQQD